jgi:hypothetical protein
MIEEYLSKRDSALRRFSSVTAKPSYYLSLLTRQLAFGEDSFTRRYPHCWLVWEAGGTHAHLSDVSLSVLETRVPDKKPAPRPTQSDSLCFALTSEGEALRIGRATENELVIAEPTISRLHARLELVGGAWHLVPISEKRKTLLAGRVADPGQRLKLSSGVSMELGGVKLSFYEPKPFKALVAGNQLRSLR